MKIIFFATELCLCLSLKKYLFFNQIQLISLCLIYFFYSKTSYIFENDSWPNSEVEPYGEDSPDALSSFSICLVGKFKEKHKSNLMIMKNTRAWILQSCCVHSPCYDKFINILCKFSNIKLCFFVTLPLFLSIPPLIHLCHFSRNSISGFNFFISSWKHISLRGNLHRTESTTNRQFIFGIVSHC